MDDTTMDDVIGFVLAAMTPPCDDADTIPTGGPAAFVVSRGAECTCGPGMCWIENGIGGYGCRCRRAPSTATDAPPCPHCGAPYQGTESSTGRLLCWRCGEYHESPFRMHRKEHGDEMPPWTGLEAEQEMYRRA